MEALEKAKLALRKHLLENKEQVAFDLNKMRQKSVGNDIFRYMENMSNAFSLCEVSTSKEILYDYSFFEMENYDFINELLNEALYSPPDSNKYERRKKGSENVSGSFFLVIL